MRRTFLTALTALASAAAVALPQPASAETTLEPPKGVWIASAAHTGLTWAWTAVPGATHYRIAISTSATITTHVRIRTVTGRVAGFGNLEPGRYYYARVRALDATTASRASETAPGKAGAVPKPIGVHPADLDAIDWRWNPYAGAVKYQVQQSSTPTFQAVLEARVTSARQVRLPVERDSYAYLRVRAVSSSGHPVSQWSMLAKAYVPYHPV